MASGGGSGASSVQVRPRLWGLRVGRCGAHVEHGLHSRDAGRVEAQRLVERRRALPSRKGSIARGATCGLGGRLGAGGGASSVQLRPRLWGLRVGRCAAHVKHGPHVCDAVRVEAQRLVERRRALPSRKGSIARGRHADWEGVGALAGAQAACGKGTNCGGCG